MKANEKKLNYSLPPSHICILPIYRATGQGRGALTLRRNPSGGAAFGKLRPGPQGRRTESRPVQQESPLWKGCRGSGGAEATAAFNTQAIPAFGKQACFPHGCPAAGTGNPRPPRPSEPLESPLRNLP